MREQAQDGPEDEGIGHGERDVFGIVEDGAREAGIECQEESRQKGTPGTAHLEAAEPYGQQAE